METHLHPYPYLGSGLNLRLINKLDWLRITKSIDTLAASLYFMCCCCYCCSQCRKQLAYLGSCWTSTLLIWHQPAGENNHLLLSILIKHLDHKNVIKQPRMQISIVNVTTHLAQQSKQQASVAIIAAISDLMRHLRKCMQYSVESMKLGDSNSELNTILHAALEQCILQLSNKVC